MATGGRAPNGGTPVCEASYVDGRAAERRRVMQAQLAGEQQNAGVQGELHWGGQRLGDRWVAPGSMDRKQGGWEYMTLWGHASVSWREDS